MQRLSKLFSTKILFFTVVIVASIFRITNLEVIEFKTDEAMNLFLSSRPVFGYPLLPGGTVSSLGILNPPLFNYLLFPVTLVTLDPKAISFFIGLLNALAIGFFYLTVKRFYGQTIALTASLLFALSPWSILFSRKIWTQDFLLPFFVPFFYSLHTIVLENNKKIYWAIYSLFSLLLLQLHQSVLFFLLLINSFLLFKKVRIDLKYVGLGIVIGIIPLFPYLIYQLQNGCPDCQTVLSVSERLTIDRSLSLFLRPLQILGQGNFYFILRDDMLTFANNFPLIFSLRPLFYLEYLLLPLGAILFVKRFSSFSFLVYASFLLPFIYYLLKFEPFMHYFLIVTPLLFIFLATAFFYFFNSSKRWIKVVAYCTLSFLLIVSFAFNSAFYSLLQKQKVFKGDYGTSFIRSKEEADTKLAKYQNRNDYRELFLLSFIPKDFMFGYLPIPKMLYPKEYSKEKIDSLEKEFKEDPDNPKIYFELAAFYTKNPTDQKTIEVLKKKYAQSEKYQDLYKSVYDDYLKIHYRKRYSSTIFEFAFDIPQHWNVKESTKEIEITGDGYIVTIQPITPLERTKIPFSNSRDRKITVRKLLLFERQVSVSGCETTDGRWCGKVYDPLSFQQTLYTVTFSKEKEDLLPKSNDERLESLVDAMDAIVYSLRSPHF